MTEQSRTGSLPAVGAIEWFRPGEHDRVERVLAELERLQIHHLRTGFSWADYHTGAGQRWYDWLMPRLAREVDVLPCFVYTPPSLGIEPKTASPPRNPRDFADFIDQIITLHGDCFEWVELWNEPNNLNDWDWRMDQGWAIFREMVAAAANWCHQRGKKTVLGGMCPTDPIWLDVLARHRVLDHFDAIGVHGFPGTWEYDWSDWNDPISKVRRVLEARSVDAAIWITEAGYSTWRHDEFEQLASFVRAFEAPADRMYWYSVHDLHPTLPHQDGFHADERHYHFGLFTHDDRPKLLSRMWQRGGLEAVFDLAELGARHAAAVHREQVGHSHVNGTARTNGHAPSAGVPFKDIFVRTNGSSPQRYTLITGGAGFIGTNLAHRLLQGGRRVRIFDSLARPGVDANLEWLCSRYSDNLEVQLEDIRDPWAVHEAVVRADQVFHFAAQVAVTSSVERPRDDFDINAKGTLNVLEALRQIDSPPPLLYTSTNKVYGGLDDVAVEARGTAYSPADVRFAGGIGPDRPLDFESPYGCSKGSADEYVIDYSRMFGLSTIVFRMSCIYGPHQFGTEDQGWIAHFLMRTIRGEPITIYGDGLQVRDVLYVDDLTRAMVMAMNEIAAIRGRAFNVGGGPNRAVSLLQVLDIIEEIHGARPEIAFAEWRPSDQRYYVSDTTALEQATGWRAETGARDGIHRLYHWMLEESPVLQRQPELHR